MKTGRNRFSGSLTNLHFSWREVILVCVVAILSYGAAKLAGTLIIGQQPEWPLWLGNAFLASVLLLVSRRMWPILIATAFSASFLYNVQTGLTIRLSALLVFSDTVEVLAAALCLSYVFGGVPRLSNVRALAKFSLFAVILPPSIGAFCVALAAKKNYWMSWRIYFLSEAIVYLTLMPAIVGWFSKEPPPRQKSRAYYLEAAGLTAGLLVFGYLTFDAPWRYSTEALLYSLVPFMLWSALRFGSTGVSTSAIAIAVLALWGAAHNRGPFIESRLLNDALSLQLFLFFTAAPFMVLAAVVEENRQANEQLFRSIFENARIGIGIFNIQAGEHFTNPATHQILGYSQEALSRTEGWDEIVHSDDRPSGAKRFAELVEGKHDKDEWEQRFIRSDGHMVIANVTCALIRDPQGKPKYVVTLNEDITERRRAETERVRVTKQMQLLLDSTGQGVYGLDLDGKCEFINKATCEMIGYRPEEVLGRNLHELVHHHKPDGSPYPVEECPVSLAVKSGKGCRTDEEVLWRRDGTAIPVEYSSFPILEEGTIKGAVVTASDITERKRAKEALQSSERLFRSVFENSQIGISFFNINGRAVFTNHAFQEILGFSDRELSQLEKWDDIIHPDERVSGAERYAKLIRGDREKDEWEQRFVRRDGGAVIANARFSLIRDAAGKPQYVASLTEDITEQKQAQEKVRESEQLFHSVYENAQIGIGIFNVRTGEHSSNRALREMLGYSQEELNRLTQWDEIVPPEERSSCAQRYAELVKGRREIDEYEQHFIHRDGRILLGNSRFQLLRDSLGEPQYVVALTEDITERRRAADALAASEQLFHTVFDNAQIAIGIMNTKTGEHVTNRALSEMLGYSEQELIRTDQWDEVVHEEDRASGAQRYTALVQGKADKDAWEQRYIRRDGKIVIGNARFKLVRDAAGEPQYVVGLSEDVTEHRRAEKELREAHHTLAQQLLAINNELELARQTQLSILPKSTPHLPGLEIAARYMPMSAVAGDFYDFVVVDEKHVGILIADVSGHGLSAALVASMLKSALPAQLPHASDPAMVLSGLNQALFGKFETHYVTAAYVFVDMANNTVSYAGAAHPPLLWWHAKTQQASECLENGLMLGPFLDSKYSAITFALEKGDEIILVTDGFLEARDSSGDQFGMDRLKRTVESNHALSANPFADALLVGLSTWSESTIGPGQTDDITLIVAGFQACS
jgi:PAS domain S-box-containing protein